MISNWKSLFAIGVAKHSVGRIDWGVVKTAICIETIQEHASLGINGPKKF
jgi:hypothetical protein